jgi:hypothetical protein
MPTHNFRYVHFIAESAQYIYNDISSMGGFFNWSMCNKRDADFWRPDGRIIQVNFTDPKSWSFNQKVITE